MKKIGNDTDKELKRARSVSILFVKFISASVSVALLRKLWTNLFYFFRSVTVQAALSHRGPHLGRHCITLFLVNNLMSCHLSCHKTDSVFLWKRLIKDMLLHKNPIMNLYSLNNTIIFVVPETGYERCATTVGGWMGLWPSLLFMPYLSASFPSLLALSVCLLLISWMQSPP